MDEQSLFYVLQIYIILESDLDFGKMSSQNLGHEEIESKAGRKNENE